MRPKLRYVVIKSGYPVIIAVILILQMMVACFSYAGQSAKEKGEHTMAYPNFEKSNVSPILADNEWGIRINYANQKSHAIFLKNDPWILSGTYRVGTDIISEFGSEIDAHILVVVTHKETKGIYYGRVIKDEPPQKSVLDSASTGGSISSVMSFFNIDIKKQCRIPDKHGKYWVVVLLGKLSSPVLEFEVK